MLAIFSSDSYFSCLALSYNSDFSFTSVAAYKDWSLALSRMSLSLITFLISSSSFFFRTPVRYSRSECPRSYSSCTPVFF